MSYKELVLFIPYIFTASLHLLFCLKQNKHPADILKLLLMPSLFIPVLYFLFNVHTRTPSLLLLAGALSGAWAGDYFLIKPVSKKKFFYGLIAFFLSHVCYITLFFPLLLYSPLPPLLAVSAAVCYAVFTVLIYVIIGRPKGLRGAASILYTVMLFTLQYTCLTPLLSKILHKQPIEASLVFLIAGIVLFTISDILLACSLFKKEFYNSRFYVMSTYIAAQLFLVYGGLLSLTGVQ